MSATKTMSNEPTTSSPPLSFSAVEVAGNTDLLTEILIRVPIKSLIRFKSVSKLWLSLISDPKFSLLHRRPSHPSAAAGLFLEGSNGEYDLFQINNSKPYRPLKSLDFGTGLSIVQSCNGLLLCWDESGRFCVFNPTTKLRTTIPPPPASICFPYSLNLAFDPSKSPHYKAICFPNFTRRKSPLAVEIYSSETRTWSLSALGFVNSGLRCCFDRGVFWNGSVYWISPPFHFLRFEVDAGQVHEIPMPPVNLNNCYMSSCYPQVSIDHLLNYNAMPPVPECLNCMASCYLQVSRGHLHFIDRHIDPGSHFLVYEMERDGSGWFVKYEVDVSQVFRRFHFDHEVRMRHLSVLCVVRCEVEAESYLLMKMNIVGKVLRYNFKDGSFCRLTVDECLNPYRVYPFIESLACV